MSKIKAISAHLDRLLDVPRWGPKELAYYKMLKEKVEKYAPRTQIIELNQDCKDIKANILEQDWFKDSQYTPIITSFLDEMEIEQYDYDEVPLGTANDGTPTGVRVETNLVVRFPRSKFKLFVYFFVDPSDKIEVQGCTLPIKLTLQSMTKFYAYLEDYDQIKRCYIAYYDTADSMGMNKEIKLPDLGHLLQIVKVGTTCSKIDLLRMFVEIILFYDESRKMNRCFIGVNYPLTISHFLRDFSTE